MAIGESAGLVDPTSGAWNLRDSEGTASSFYFGNPGGDPVAGGGEITTTGAGDAVCHEATPREAPHSSSR